MRTEPDGIYDWERQGRNGVPLSEMARLDALASRGAEATGGMVGDSIASAAMSASLTPTRVQGVWGVITDVSSAPIYLWQEVLWSDTGSEFVAPSTANGNPVQEAVESNLSTSVAVDDVYQFFPGTGLAGALWQFTSSGSSSGGSPPFSDATPILMDDGDNTKLLAFELSGLTTSTTRTLTVPDTSDTLVLLTFAQTISNKTLDISNTYYIGDCRLYFEDCDDPTRLLQFDLGNLTPGATRTLTWPDLSGTPALTTGAQTIQSKTFDDSNNWTTKDSSLTLENGADTTKKLTFDLGNLTTSTTRNITWPDLTGTPALTTGSQTITGKTFDNGNTWTTKDTSLTLQNGADTTKQATLDLGSITSGATRTLTLPNANTTLIGRDTTDTLTGKTFDTAGSGNVLKINGTTVSDKTGTGKMVLDTSPTMVTPVLGVATATTINKLAITTPATGSTLTIADGKTATISNTVTLTGTDGSSYNLDSFGTATNTATEYTGTTTSAYATIFDQTVTAGLHGSVTIKNSHGTNALNYQYTVFDMYGGSTSANSNLTAGQYFTFSFDSTQASSTIRPPYKQFKLEVKDAVSGTHATYDVWKSTIN